MYTPKVDSRTLATQLKEAAGGIDFCTFRQIQAVTGLSRCQWDLRRRQRPVPALPGAPKKYQITHVAAAITGYKFTRN